MPDSTGLPPRFALRSSCTEAMYAALYSELLPEAAAEINGHAAQLRRLAQVRIQGSQGSSASR